MSVTDLNAEPQKTSVIDEASALLTLAEIMAKCKESLRKKEYADVAHWTNALREWNSKATGDLVDYAMDVAQFAHEIIRVLNSEAL